MLGKLRDPDGNYTLLATGCACLLLGSVFGHLLFTQFWPLPAGFLVTGIISTFRWWRQQREARYDLRRLFDASPLDEELIGPDPEGMGDGYPYCGWCDECYPSGTHRCRQCGRDLG